MNTNSAFVSSPISLSSNRSGLFGTSSTASVCTAPTAPVVTMRCRRDLKKEKALRNLEFARSHRKKVVRTWNRRAVNVEKTNGDNEYLSSIYGTITFGEKGSDTKGDNGESKGERRGRDDRRGGGRGGGGGRRF